VRNVSNSPSLPIHRRLPCRVLSDFFSVYSGVFTSTSACGHSFRLTRLKFASQPVRLLAMMQIHQKVVCCY